MKLLSSVCICLLIATSSFADDLSVSPIDSWTIELTCSVETSRATPLTARTTVTQPQGFSQVLSAPVEVHSANATWQLIYPLIDEGRFDPQPGNWNGYWSMGEYEFRVELMDGDHVIHATNTGWDPMSACPRDRYGPICSAYPHQFIVCSPGQPAYIDEDEMSFTIGTIPSRLPAVTTTVDVTSGGSDQRRAGPWRLELTGQLQQHTFDASGWPRGEYWIRVRVEREGNQVGPYLIRKVWKETLPAVESHSRMKRTSARPQLVGGPAGWSDVDGIKFVAVPLKKTPPGPLVTMEQPWETELLYYRSIHYDQNAAQFELDYTLANGAYERTEERAALPTTLCRAVSIDGIHWTKPSLGLVQYKGNRANNLVPEAQAYVAPRPPHLAPHLTHDLEKACFRPYDATGDGPPNLDNVFVTAVKRSFVQKCSDPSATPYSVGSWPMEKRGDDYLVLTKEPILYLGVGMDLVHSTEKIALHLEDQATGRLYYFFRPGAPAYPPHDTTYDNMHMARRVLGVMWTDDGIHWQRRLVLVPDDNDEPGTQFYYLSSIASRQQITSGRPAMALENHWNKGTVRSDEPILGVLSVYDARANMIWPELVYATDLLHWHRFADRKKWIANGPPGSADFGLVKIAAHRLEFGTEWWFPYQAINQYHQDFIGLAKMASLEALKRAHPNYVEMPGFENWSQYWKRCKSVRYTCGVGRCQAGRVSYAEPSSHREGRLTTEPVLLEDKTLYLNTKISPGGKVRVCVLNQSGEPIAGLGAQECLAIEADSMAAPVRWTGRSLDELRGTAVRLRFTLHNARLYSYHFN
jgi:hypothetical protein